MKRLMLRKIEGETVIDITLEPVRVLDYSQILRGPSLAEVVAQKAKSARLDRIMDARRG